MPKIVISGGYLEENWISIQSHARDLTESLSSKGFKTIYHVPSLHKKPRWYHRRLFYPMSKTPILHIADAGYADFIITHPFHYEVSIVTIHDLEFWTQKKWINAPVRNLLALGVKKSDFKIAISKKTQAELKKQLGVSSSYLIYPGRPLEKFPLSLRAREKGCLLFVGEPSIRKGFDRALQLLKALPQHYYMLHAGNKPNSSYMHTLKKMGLENRIYFLGVLKDLAPYYHKAECVLIPSRREGFSFPAIEARLCGTSICVSENVPATEILSGDLQTFLMDFSVWDQKNNPNQQLFISSFLKLRFEPLPLENRTYFGTERMALEVKKVYHAAENLLSTKL